MVPKLLLVFGIVSYLFPCIYTRLLTSLKKKRIWISVEMEKMQAKTYLAPTPTYIDDAPLSAAVTPRRDFHLELVFGHADCFEAGFEDVV